MLILWYNIIECKIAFVPNQSGKVPLCKYSLKIGKEVITMKKRFITSLFVLFAVMLFGTTALATSTEEAVADPSFIYVDEAGNQKVHFPSFYLDDIFQTELTWDDPLAYRMSEQQEAVQEKYCYKLIDHAKALLKNGAKVSADVSQDESSGKHQVSFKIYLEADQQFIPMHGMFPRACAMEVKDEFLEYNVYVTLYSIDIQINLPF